MANITATQSHNSDEWETPPWLIHRIEAEFGRIMLDPCCTVDNSKGQYSFTKSDDGLSKPWVAPLTYCNPPYSQVGEWAKKAYFEAMTGNTTALFLCAARTDTRWWWRYVRHGEVRFLQGRLRFYYDGQPTKVSAPFPSALAVFRKDLEMVYSPTTVYWGVRELKAER